MKFFLNLYKLTNRILPLKAQRMRYKNFCLSLDLKKDLISTKENYLKVIEKLKNKKGKIKVAFLVRENQKWTYQSLYEEFEKSEKFEPLVLVSILTLVDKGKDKTRNNLEENYDFFKLRGMNVDYAYREGKYLDLKAFEPDIIFYDQPWDLPEMHKPKNVSSFALACYSSYGYEILENFDDYTQDFHGFLYKFFVEDEINIKRYASYNKNNAENCVTVGYTKYDDYFKNQNCEIWKNKDKLKVIYAPHHSLDKKGLKLSTFNENGKFILELAKKNPDVTWVFKPHPRLKYALLRTKTMTQNEIENYFKEWEQVGVIYEKGDYINIFQTSDLMITDSVSFLAEYLPTNKPLIRLVNKKGAQLNTLGEKMLAGYYFANNKKEIENLFYDLLFNGNDPKKELRCSIKNEFLSGDKKCCEKIFAHLSNCIKEGL